jgi:tetratricopeptide (TPR) repeat protein
VIRALSAIGQGTREANVEAERLCRRAIALAPNYGQAHSLLAWALLRRTIWEGALSAVMPEATAQVQTALAIDDRDPWAYMAQGQLMNRSRRFDDAARALRRALELNPNFAPAYAMLACVLGLQEAYHDAIDCAERALRLSPNDRSVGLYALLGLAIAHFSLGHYSESSTWARLAVEKGPGHDGPHTYLTASLALQGAMTAAADARDALLRLRPEFSLLWMKENLPIPINGERSERLHEALRKAGVPEA